MLAGAITPRLRDDVITLNGIEQTDSPKSIANLAKKE
jgi:hypothetical protein